MKTIIVTGVSGQLGTAIANRLFESGYFVVGISRSKPNAILSNGLENFHWEEFDLARIEDIPETVGRLREKFGPIFGLVNNAAVGADAVLPTMHNSDIQSSISLNLVSPIVLTKSVVRKMLIDGPGRIVNITSVVAKTGYKGLSVYASAKAGLEGFTRSLARELGPRKITVNSVAPGFMETAMTSKLQEQHLQKIVNRTPLGRLVECSEVASAVEFLFTDEAKAVSGQTLIVDGGASA